MGLTLVQLRTRVRDILGEASSGARYWDDADIDNYINDAAKIVARTLPTDALVSSNNTQPGLLKIDATLDAVQDQANYLLPVDFLRMVDVRITYAGMGEVQAKPISPRVGFRYQQQTGKATQDNPYYYLWGGDIYFVPAPDAVGTNNIALWYLAVPPIMSDDDDPEDTAEKVWLPDVYRPCLVDYAAAQCFVRRREMSAAQLYENRFREALSLSDREAGTHELEAE